MVCLPSACCFGLLRVRLVPCCFQIFICGREEASGGGKGKVAWLGADAPTGRVKSGRAGSAPTPCRSLIFAYILLASSRRRTPQARREVDCRGTRCDVLLPACIATGGRRAVDVGAALWTLADDSAGPFRHGVDIFEQRQENCNTHR